ncbi:MAG: hypothetical protein ACRDL6_09180 [Solirubrobacterales bacterium]
MKLWKLQKFAGDVVYDMRSRNLLPVAILLVVGIVAVPFVLGSSGSEPGPASSPATKSESELAPENQAAVLAYNPGVRDYKQRLDELAAKDPFKQQFTQAASAATQLNSEVVSSEGSGGEGAGTTPSASPDDVSKDVSTDSGGSGGSRGKVRARYFYHRADVLVGDAALPLQRRNNLALLTQLPSEANPVLVFLGTTLDGKRALFIVSSEVSQVSGPGECVPKPDDCSLLALRAGQSEDLFYDLDAKIYRIKVDRIKRVVSSKPPRR